MEAEILRIEKPAVPAIVARLAPMVAEARAFAVVDVETHGMALERIKAIRSGEKEITELFEDARKKAEAAKKSILATRDGLVGPLAEARTAYDRNAATYEEAERRKTEEEQRRLQELARKEEEERILAQAQEAQAAGDHAQAEAIVAQEVLVPTVRVAPAIAQVEGVSSRTLWSAEVSDVAALVRNVAAHPDLLHLLEPNLPALNRMAISLRENLRIPGVRAVSKTSRATR